MRQRLRSGLATGHSARLITNDGNDQCPERQSNLHSIGTFQEIEKQITGQKAQVQISDNGIWLREASDDGSYILHGLKVVNLDKQIFKDISVLMFDAQGVFTHRLRAKRGRLIDNVWRLKKVEIIVSGKAVERRASLTLGSQFEGMNLAQQKTPILKPLMTLTVSMHVVKITVRR